VGSVSDLGGDGTLVLDQDRRLEELPRSLETSAAVCVRRCLTSRQQIWCSAIEHQPWTPAARLVVGPLELTRFGGQFRYAASGIDFKFNRSSNSIGLT
jgi:hypothetical protein